ncbi:hypothetical protein ABE504_08055 [Paenibacillus oryzisoli]
MIEVWRHASVAAGWGLGAGGWGLGAGGWGAWIRWLLRGMGVSVAVR